MIKYCRSMEKVRPEFMEARIKMNLWERKEQQ